MFKEAVFTRYLTYFLGALTTAVNIFLLTYFLEVNEFAVWGISMSLVYLISQVGQLTYVQYIDKYFPNISIDKMKIKIYQFIKTIIIFSPVWYCLLLLLNSLNYFDKFYIENINILFLLISSLCVLESCIEVVSKFMLASRNTKNFDVKELLIIKIFRVALFYFLLVTGYSIYHLLFVSILIRGLFLIFILKTNEPKIFTIIKNILSANILNENFENFKYTFYAFLIKVLQTSFLNLIFLIFSNFSSSDTIATYSIGIIIVNNLRPIVSSFTSLLTPSISEKANKNESPTLFLRNSAFLISFISGFFILGILIFIEFKGLYSRLFIQYDQSFYDIVCLAVLSSTINPIFQPAFNLIKFSNQEKNLFSKLSVNYFSLLVLSFLITNFQNSLIIIYILFELVNLFTTQYLYSKNFEKTYIYFWSKFYLLCASFLLIDILVFDLPLNYFTFFIVFIVYLELRKIFSSKHNFLELFDN